ncbi:hypothetical protein H5410_050922 [Solanum commersonii]|uniref:Uncharacterized protein n=1 Tax=Solanum commersonii TaxID=4109 RepID=A0A9J5WY56_SOLCO|nr:hypothetical protein H5410_050922 [Solanum commersonii]
MHDKLSLVVPALVTELCKQLEVLRDDTWVKCIIPIFPLKMCGEGTMLKCRKRKVDSDKSVHMENDSPTPLIYEPFDTLANELKIIKEISEFDAYLKDQRNKKSQLENLEKG